MDHNHIAQMLKSFGVVKAISYVQIDPDFPGITNGDRKVIMELKRPIPNFVKIGPYELQINYRGVIRTCRICKGEDHLAADCPNIKCRNCLGTGHIAKWCTVAPSANKPPVTQRSYAQVVENFEPEIDFGEIGRQFNETLDIEQMLTEGENFVVDVSPPLDPAEDRDSTSNRRETIVQAELEAFKRKPTIPRSPPRDRVFGTTLSELFTEPKDRVNQEQSESRNNDKNRLNGGERTDDIYSDGENKRSRKKKRESPEGEKKKPNLNESQIEDKQTKEIKRKSERSQSAKGDAYSRK